jgi:hypothetical protein
MLDTLPGISGTPRKRLKASMRNRARSVLLPIGWETHLTPEMGASPQMILNHQVLEDLED